MRTYDVGAADDDMFGGRTSLSYVSVNVAVACAPPESVATMDFWPSAPPLPRHGIMAGQEKVPSIATMAVHDTVLAFFGLFLPDM